MSDYEEDLSRVVEYVEFEFDGLQIPDIFLVFGE
jgi:hypothetical protein